MILYFCTYRLILTIIKNLFVAFFLQFLAIFIGFGQFSPRSRSEETALVRPLLVPWKAPDTAAFQWGGEWREYLQVYDNFNFGEVPGIFKTDDFAQLMHRWQIHASLRVGGHFRVFAQANSTFRFLNSNPITNQVDQNKISIHQLFGEIKLNKNSLLRIGKLENYFGADRLLASREGPNNRNTFFGGVFRTYRPKGQLDLFYVHAMTQLPGSWDDQISKELVSGAYWSQYPMHSKGHFMDAYAMYFFSPSREYQFLRASDERITMGTRFFANLPDDQYSVELAHQFGTFANQKRISAFMLMYEYAHRIQPKWFLGLAGSYAPGDKNLKDLKQNTFNTLFARPPFGQTLPLNITNVINFSPFLRFHPSKQWFLLARVSFLQRQSTQDGIYTPNMTPMRPILGKNLDLVHHQMGKIYVLEASIFPHKQWQLLGELGYCQAGEYLKATGSSKDIKYWALKAGYRF